jgi:cyclase
MQSVRVIPTLLIDRGDLYKTTKFRNPQYVGDPINAIRIFNTKEVDELVVLDITATADGREPDLEMIRNIASECFMPLAYGGGIRTLQQIERILNLGVEKVVLNNAALAVPTLVSEAATAFGAQAIVVSIDVKLRFFGGYEVVSQRGTRYTGLDPLAHARAMQDRGAGEILLTAVDRDGTMQGYDLKLIAKVSNGLEIPVIAAGGAGKLEDFASAIMDGASAVAAGAMFVFQGPHRAVLISYLRPEEIARLALWK